MIKLMIKLMTNNIRKKQIKTHNETNTFDNLYK